jgi:hypothetical protein
LAAADWNARNWAKPDGPAPMIAIRFLVMLPSKLVWTNIQVLVPLVHARLEAVQRACQ